MRSQIDAIEEKKIVIINSMTRLYQGFIKARIKVHVKYSESVLKTLYILYKRYLH